MISPSVRALTAFCLTALLAAGAAAQSPRALLVGINLYAPPPGRAPAGRTWQNLDGAVRDAEAMQGLLVARFGFPPARVRLLRDAEATRAAILGGLATLAREAQAGDEVVFFYAGHGSQVRNTASAEADGLDETLVPADAPSGAPDLRDKELRDAFAAIARTGARLTVILDACHSGSALRGVGVGRLRRVEAAPTAVADASVAPAPETLPGVLVLSAAQDDEPAREVRDDEGRARGAFSWALVQTLADAGQATAAEVFQRVRARVKERGLSQEPVLAGSLDRRSAPLFGGAAAQQPVRLPVLEARRGRLVVQGGEAVGVRPGARLAAVLAPGDTLRVTVRASDGIGRSVADLPERVRLPAGTVFTVEGWDAMPDNALRLWIPARATAAQQQAFAAARERLSAPPGVTFVQDPVATPPTHTLAFTARGWRLAGPDGRTQSLPGPALPVLPAGASVLLLPSLPDSADALLRRALRVLPVALVETPEEAQYVLVVQTQGAFWLRTGAPGAGATLPLRTDAAAGARLSDALARQAAQLARVSGWLTLSSPPDAQAAFPYRFAGFENARTGERRAPGDTLRAGERYRAVLALPAGTREATQRAAQSGELQSRFVYLFALDGAGRGTLLYPALTSGSVENRLKLTGEIAPEVRLPTAARAYLFEVAPPFGADTFFLLTTEEPLPDPTILNFDGVRTRRAPAGLTPLARLLFRLGETTRGDDGALPATWSIERLTVPSAAR